MTIASEITRINNNISSAYTAVNNKGGTLPSTQNSANLATAIGSIPSGYTELPSYQVSNGVASKRSGALTGNEFSDITSIDNNGLAYAFYQCTGLTGQLDLSSLTSVGNYGLYYTFLYCTGLTGDLNLPLLTTVGNQGLMYAFAICIGLTGVNLSSLTTVGDSGLNGAFVNCTGLTYVYLDSLTTVGYHGLYSAFRDCTGLTSVDLPSLTTIDSRGFENAFMGCTGLTDVYFNSVTTTTFISNDQFGDMLNATGTSVTHTLHFPSNLESTIQGLYGYPTFGGTSGYVVLAFDLPATS